MSTLPLDFPGLQIEARRLAEEAIAAAKDPADARRLGTAGGPMSRAFARLLADLTRPESQCFWLRALATKYGQPLPALGCPTWRRHGHGVAPDGQFFRWYTLSAPGWRVAVHAYTDDVFLPGVEPQDQRVYLAGIRTCSPTAEGDAAGLHLALCAAFGVAP